MGRPPRRLSAPSCRGRRPSAGRSPRSRPGGSASRADSRPPLITASGRQSVEQLVEVLRDDHDRRAVRGQVDQRLMDRRRRAASTPQVGCADDQHARVLQDLAADDEFLQVAARQAARRRCRRRACATSKSLITSRGEVARLAGASMKPPRDQAHAAGSRSARALSASVISGTARVAVALLGHAAQAERAALRRRRAGRRACRRCGSRLGRRPSVSPLSAAISSFWPLPATPAMPRISPARDLEARCPCRSTPNASRRGRSRACDRQRGRRRRRARRALAACLQLGADHHLAPCRARSRRLGSQCADHLAAAQDRGAVAQRPDLVQLVADVEDRAALGRQPAQRLEQLLDLLRRQHRGRLVHDQQLRVLQQAAHDLDALALADRQRVHARARDRAAGRRRRHDLAMRLASAVHVGDARRAPSAMFSEHGQRLEQREVLEHHADAERARGRAGRRSRTGLPSQQDLALVGRAARRRSS